MQIVRRTIPPQAQALAAAGLHPVLARVFAARGVLSAQELDATLVTLPTFHSLRGIDAAAKRVADAVEQRQRIVVVADYDADGATACAVAVAGLGALGADVRFVVPNRFEYGYGLTPEIVRDAALLEPGLIVTVDNGISSLEGVSTAASLGIDVLVTDHHLPGPTLPAPAWIVNPNQPGCGFPSRHLAGVGVMFYVLLAVRAELRARGRLPDGGPNLAALLDLVALGTVADVVRLDRLNRTLVAHGLARIRAGRARPGVSALFAVAGRDPARATSDELGFVAGPRLNAAGRLSDMSIGIRCLLCTSEEEARPLAAELERLNRERREVEAQMQAAAWAELDARASAGVAEDAWTVCVHQPDWHPGVIGIVAARLKDRLHRPAVVFAPGPGLELRGSGRSIPGFHLRDALDLVAKRCPGVVLRFGGHAFAAGLSIVSDGLSAFATAFEDVARAMLSASDLRRTLETDGPLGAGELDVTLAREMRSLVWGQGFPAPVFDDVFKVDGQRVVAQRHSRLALLRPGERFEAILFNHVDPLPPQIRAAYRPEVNEWNGYAGLQLVIEHWTEHV